jgi:hypothetical protein
MADAIPNATQQPPAAAPTWRNEALAAVDRARLVDAAEASGRANDLAQAFATVFGPHEHPDRRRGEWEAAASGTEPFPDYWGWVAMRPGVVRRTVDVVVYEIVGENAFDRVASCSAAVSWALTEAEQVAAVRVAALAHPDIAAVGIAPDRLQVDVWSHDEERSYWLVDDGAIGPMVADPALCRITELRMAASQRASNAPALG